MVQRSTINTLQSDLAFANLYLLRHKYNTEILFHMEHLIRHFESERLNGYSFPIGGSCSTLNECIHAIEQDAAARKRPHSYCLLTAEQALYLQRIYGERIRFTCNNGDADYLYKRSNLVELPGTAYHKKRTHAAKFSRLHPDAEFRKLSNENKEDVLYIAKHWLTAHPCPHSRIQCYIDSHREHGYISTHRRYRIHSSKAGRFLLSHSNECRRYRYTLRKVFTGVS